MADLYFWHLLKGYSKDLVMHFHKAGGLTSCIKIEKKTSISMQPRSRYPNIFPCMGQSSGKHRILLSHNANKWRNL